MIITKKGGAVMDDTKKAAREGGKTVEIFADVLGEVQQLQKQALFLSDKISRLENRIEAAALQFKG